MKKIVFILIFVTSAFFARAQSFVSIDPDSALVGQTLTTIVTAQ